MKRTLISKYITVTFAVSTLLLGGQSMAEGMESLEFKTEAVTTPSVQASKTITVNQLSNEWDKTFPENTAVHHEKVVFQNRYGITLVGDLYMPKNIKDDERLSAIAVAGPYGAVKEQVSGRYAQEMANRGFITLAFDPSFTGESGGEPRNTTSPDINTEDFSAAVDYLSNHPFVDADKIGLIGICGWGGICIECKCHGSSN